jgi:ABC-type transporter Mla subunit MlaD
MTWLIPAWLKRAVAGIVAGVVLLWGAWVMGRRDGTQAGKVKAAAKAAGDLTKAKAVRDEVDSISGGDVSDRLSKWRRK